MPLHAFSCRTCRTGGPHPFRCRTCRTQVPLHASELGQLRTLSLPDQASVVASRLSPRRRAGYREDREAARGGGGAARRRAAERAVDVPRGERRLAELVVEVYRYIVCSGMHVCMRLAELVVE